jgi:predicted O-linked N-acetylglucosamine transferase (SPINDLY family)
MTEQIFQRAVALQQAGHARQAAELYQQVLAAAPSHSGALQNMALIAFQTGDLPTATELIQKLVQYHPQLPDPHDKLGIVLGKQRKWDQAIAAHQRAVALSPESPEFHYNFGTTLRDAARWEEAAARFRKTIALSPKFVDAHTNLAGALRELNHLDEALESIRRAIALRPADSQAHCTLASIYQRQSKFRAAADAAQEATRLGPTYAQAFISLCIMRTFTEEYDLAIEAGQKAVELAPSDMMAHFMLGVALRYLCRFEEAMGALQNARKLAPEAIGPAECLIFTRLFDPASNLRNFPDAYTDFRRRFEEPLRSEIRPHRNTRDAHRRLRIGYASPDLRDHAVGRNMVPLLENHDRDQFEIYCYSYRPQTDPISERLTRASGCWRNITLLSDAAACDLIRADEIDILVDLALHTSGNRLILFARKPAPVQMTFAGYPGSTGLSTIDYRISDPYLDPPGMNESIYTEKTRRLPDSFWCYDPLEERDLRVSPLPADKSGYITFGCLNTVMKTNLSIAATWARVLHRVERSRMMLLVPPSSYRDRLLDVFAAGGIDAQRIEFVERQQHRQYMQLYDRIDLCLDTFPYNGHTTSLDGMWMGVPTISLMGEPVASRAGWCQLSNIGLPELVARSPEEFVTVASALASDVTRLRELRSTLRERMERSPLLDAKKIAAGVEAAYRFAWTRWCESESIPK